MDVRFRAVIRCCDVYNSKRCGNCSGFAAMLSYADLSIGSLQERRYCFGNRIFSSFSRLLRSVCLSWHRDTCNMSCRGTSGRPSISWDGRKNGYTEIHRGEFCLFAGSFYITCRLPMWIFDICFYPFPRRENDPERIPVHIFQICEDHFVEIRNVQIPVNRIHPVFIEAIVASAAEYVFVIDFSGDDPLVTGVYFRRVLIQCGMPQKPSRSYLFRLFSE